MVQGGSRMRLKEGAGDLSVLARDGELAGDLDVTGERGTRGGGG